MEQYTITSPFKHEETFFSQFETEDIHLEGWLQAGLINDDSGYVDMYFNTHTQKMASFIQFCDWYTSVMWPSLT